MTAAIDVDLLRRVEQVLFCEARLLDEHEVEAWESLWDDDAVYWIPANGDDIDPTRQMSIVFDNRARIATRVKQLLTGKRHSQSPPSRLRRFVTNVELLDSTDVLVVAAANILVYESRFGRVRFWAARTTYHLRDRDGVLRLVTKEVRLVDNDQPLPTLAFLL